MSLLARWLGPSAAVLALVGTAAASPGVPLEDETAAQRWLRDRIRRAQHGKRDLVRVPIAFQSTGWGCICPPHYVGDTPISTPSGDVTWLEPVYADGVAPPESTDAGWVILAEGEFTGEVETMREGELYRMHGFRVMRWRVLSDYESATLRVVERAEDRRAVAPLADGRPWLVVAASIDRSVRGSATRAGALRESLVRAGFAAAEVLDSHAAPRLFCCYEVVVAGRFATRAEADALATQARRRGFRPNVRQGF